MAIFSIIFVWFSSFINPIFNLLFDEKIASLFGGASLFSILFGFMIISITVPILIHSSFSNFKASPSKSERNNTNRNNSNRNNSNRNNDKGDK